MTGFVQHLKVEPIRASVTLLTLRIFLFMFLVDTIYTISEIVFLELDVPSNIHRYITLGMFITHVLKNIFLIYIVMNLVMQWVGNMYFITEKYLLKREGIINVKEKIYDMKIIRAVSVNQGLIGRLFNYGDITIRTSASGGYNDEIYLMGIAQPEKYKEIFQHYLEIYN
jgi:uncharacterized membrane protein YdbT with pleckstrin-like domain